MYDQKYYLVLFNNEFYRVTSKSFEIEIIIEHKEISHIIFQELDILGFWNMYTIDSETSDWPEIYKPILK